MRQKSFKSKFFYWLYRYRYLHLMALPCLLYFIIFKYLPMYGIIIAFQDYKGFSRSFLANEWVGLKNFARFFQSIYFWRLLRNTLILSCFRLTIGFVSPIILALQINELKSILFKRTVQTITYMPYFLSWVVTAGILMTILSPDNGPVNVLLGKLFGIEPIYFVSDSRFFRGILVASDIWKEVGWGSIIYLAAITGVNPELYEAVTVDGGSRWQKIWYITLPSIKEIVAIMFILAVGRILDQNFDQIFNLYNPVVYEVADVFDTYVYRSGIKAGEFSYATAIGLFKSLVALLMVSVSNVVSKKLGSEGLW
ncbi:putative multiple-sugar transport system permease YteP [Clostridia bacterium]|nr:putative multiple-sugar transport system permease YteP [Clostridia bacterium]